MNTHRQRQLEVIAYIERQVKQNELQFTTVQPVEDYFNDKRICLTGVHFPDKTLLTVAEQVIHSLREIEPSYFYYPRSSLHMTVKNVRCISDPPNFTEDEVYKAKAVFSEIIPQHKTYHVYFYRLLFFRNNVSLIGTTDPELDELVLDLDKKLNEEGLPDDKRYANAKYFFCNITLARYQNASEAFMQKVDEISKHLTVHTYLVGDVSLVTGNAAFTRLNIINTWKLKQQ